MSISIRLPNGVVLGRKTENAPEQAAAPRVPQEERLAICAACPEHTVIVGKLVCKKCGCVCAWKAGILGQKCPINKW